MSARFFVDDIAQRRAPWAGGLSCHLLTDGTLEELIEFAYGVVGIPKRWLHRASCDHFDLSPKMRAIAIQKGAIPLTGWAFSAQYWNAVANKLEREGADPTRVTAARKFAAERAARAAARA